MMIPEKSFGLTLIPFAILASLPLFILFIVPWFKRDRTFLKRLMSTTYICSLLNIILLSLVTLDALYSKLHGVEYGMYIALIGNALMLIASRSSKQERDD
jgi:cytochrome c biogenesis factor